MRRCFLCETPYQVFTALNMMISYKWKSEESDIYIGNTFKNASVISKRIIDSGLFKNVYLYDYSQINRIKNKKVTKNIEILFPKLYQKLILGNKPFGAKYDCTLLSTISPFASSFILSREIEEINYFDDGMGSYFNAVGVSTLSSYRKKVYKILGRNADIFYPKRYYLYNLSILQDRLDTEYIELSKYTSEESIKLFSYIFLGSENYVNLYSDKKIIWLTDVIADNPSNRSLNEKIISFLRSYKESIIVKPHPRETLLSFYSDFEIVNKETFWELDIRINSFENHILIGNMSTAQFTPKLFADQEPYIIFTFLMSEGNTAMHKKKSCLVEKLKKLYYNPNKIFSVSSIDELKNAIDSSLKSISKLDKTNS